MLTVCKKLNLPENFATFKDYCFPSGYFAAKVFHLLHWPPKKPGKRDFAGLEDLFYNSFLLQLIVSVFVETSPLFEGKGSARLFVHDTFCKSTELNNNSGIRKEDVEIYESKKLLELH